MTTGTTPKGYPYPNGDDPISAGDDVIKSLATAVDTHLGRAASGTVAVTVGSLQSVAVTFPVGRFTAAPRVVVSSQSTADVSNPTLVGAVSITTAGFTLTGSRASGGSSFTAHWIAIQV